MDRQQFIQDVKTALAPVFDEVAALSKEDKAALLTSVGEWQTGKDVRDEVTRSLLIKLASQSTPEF